VCNTIRITFAKIAFSAYHIDLVKMDIAEGTCQHAHLAANAPLTDNFNGTGVLIFHNCRRRTNFQAPGILTVQACLWETDLYIIVVFHPDV